MSIEQHDTQSEDATQMFTGAVLFDPTLTMLGNTLDDIERVRIACGNRLGTLLREGEYGYALTADHPSVQALGAQFEALKQLEHQSVLALRRQLRTHSLYPWVKEQKGLGDKTVARLLGVIGDPYWNDMYDRPRLVSELRTYCGVGDAAQQVRHRGVKGNWSPDAKKRLYLIAECMVKNRDSAYRATYEKGRLHYVDAVHATACAQCKHAEPGTPLRDGHQHMRAMRLVMKEVLKDLWRESKRLHELTIAQGSNDIQIPPDSGD